MTGRLVLVLLTAVLGLGGLTWSKVGEERRLRQEIDRAEGCFVALGGRDLVAVKGACPVGAQAVFASAAAARTCDEALANGPRGGDLFTMRAACRAPTLRVVAERDAALRDASHLRAELNVERAGRARAIARAEARTRTETERKLRASAALESAPRDGGLLVLDAGRLRQLGAAAGSDGD